MTPIRASRRKYHIIYKTTCLVTGKWYIGMHSTDDLGDGYMGSGQQLRRSVKKYGKECHKTEVLEYLPDREALWKREEELITKKLMEDELCMNLATGGQGKVDRPLVTKASTEAKLSAASKAAVRTEEWCAKISASNRGKPKPRSEEGDKAWREKVVGRKPTDDQIERLKAGQQSSEQFKKRYRPFSVDDVTYQNGREAVTALGLKGSTLTYRLLSPNWLNYHYHDAPKDPTSVSARARGEYSK